MHKTLLVFMVTVGAWIAVPGIALAINCKFCFNYEVDYDDALGGDFWTNDDDRPARGMWVQITRSDGTHVFWGYTDSDDGCTGTYALSSAYTYTIDAYLKARIGDTNSNYVRVRATTTANDYVLRLATNFHPAENHPAPYNYTYPDGTANFDASYLAAAPGFALHRKPGGVGGETMYVINHECPGGSTSCVAFGQSGTPYVFISQNSRDNKYTICHEIGHWIGIKRNGGQSWNHDYDWYSDPVCQEVGGGVAAGHDLFSMEENRAAVNEGWADFYAAAIWNDETEDDCSFWTNYLDHDRDGQLDFSHIYSCYPGMGYEGEFCTLCDFASTEYDWMRFWWAWHSAGKSVSDLASLIVLSDPDTWYVNTVYNDLTDAAVALSYPLPTWIVYATVLNLAI